MKLNPAIKAWLVENAGVKSDASDDEFRLALGKTLAEGTLTIEKYTELSMTKEVEESNELVKKFDQLISALTPKQEEEVKETVATSKAADPALKGVVDTITKSDSTDGNVRVKGAHEAYSSNKATLTYPSHDKHGRPHVKANQPVTDFSESGRSLETPSDLDKAVAGAYAKLLVAQSQRKSRSVGWSVLPEHDRELLTYAMQNMKWGGSSQANVDRLGDYADIVNRSLTPAEQKALIDDATSGGLEAAPIVFDDMIIQAPLLTNELFPRVNVVPLDRGRRVEGVAIGKVTGSWGGVDDSAISLFNTASYVSAFDTTIYRWEGALRIGLDFLSDTPIDFGSLVTAQYAERLAEDLDDVIATGNGTTQPEGIINKSGTTSVNFGGSTSLSNYESLRFGVSKQEHKGRETSAIFCGTETSYQRARAIPVGTSDARRIFGMDYSSYKLMEHDYAINGSLANTQVFYAVMNRYRMYRRRGLTMRTSTEGDTLIRNNEMLMVATARFGGQLERGACAAVTTTAPA